MDSSTILSARQAAAVRYWRATTALAACHVFGLPWPPGPRCLRTRMIGHWGANPGIAWIVGHLAAHWTGRMPVRIVVGTGHATSFTVAHEAVRCGWGPEEITAAISRYGMPGGDPSEIIGFPDHVPQLFGELGSAIAVSQALARGSDEPTVCIVGDGELETPVALAALAHFPVLFGGDRVPWIVAVNANGARMGSAARFSADALDAIFRTFGFEVVRSGLDSVAAANAATDAVTALERGRPLAWVSETPKGWPAPAVVGGMPFRGHHAHKPPKRVSDVPTKELLDFVGELSRGQIDADGKPCADVRATAGRAVFGLPIRRRPRPCAAATTTRRQGWCAAPIEGADRSIMMQRARTFCPDEAASNGLVASLRAGLVTEVLAEEVCVAWTIGAAEAGAAAIFASYEAFAPLAATQIAQYAKLLAGREPRHAPAVGILITSLGWANTPSHQNSDFVSCFLNRSYPFMRLVCPVGATSTQRRLSALVSDFQDGIYCVVCSKHQLPDLPDPGGDVVRYRLCGSNRADATIIALGDVCVAEAVAAMSLAKVAGKTLEVLAILEPTRLDEERSSRPARLPVTTERALAVTWCAAQPVRSLIWTAAGRRLPVFGLGERFAPTPAETLRASRMDRVSLLASLWPQEPWPAGIDPSLDRNDPLPRFCPLALDCEEVLQQ